jgi:predicted ATPase
MWLLERDPFLEQLHTWLREVTAGQGRFVLLGGEAGVGKTVLMHQFAEIVRQTARVLSGACDPLSTPPPLGPLVDIARGLGGPLAQLLATAASREQIFEACLAAVGGSARTTLVIVEDVHWADEATLDVLRHLARRLVSRRVLLVCTYRDDEVGPRHPLRVMMGDLATSVSVRRLTLPRLSEAAVGELASSSGVELRELYRQTAGNPFYVTEILATGISSGLPQTVRDAVLARAARLPTEARAMLEAAAVIGTRVEPWLLLGISHTTETAIESCTAAGVMLVDGDLLTFRHELARRRMIGKNASHRPHASRTKTGPHERPPLDPRPGADSPGRISQ